MTILALPRVAFETYMQKQNVTDENVERFNKVAFISILSLMKDIGNNEPYFKNPHPNVLNIVFDDVPYDIHLKNPNENGAMSIRKAITREQANEIYSFVKANSDKEVFVIHCTAGVARSGAVAKFVNDYFDGDADDFDANNPSIFPNQTVYNLLHDSWREDKLITKSQSQNDGLRVLE